MSAEASRYRAHLDGLRAVAVYLVVAFHVGLGWFSGGFIGVDVFFVLSGFLVTGILMRDLAKRGRIDWRRFYSRRVRRILPAAIVTLLAVSVAYSIIAAPAEIQTATGGFRAAFLYVSNWYFIHQSTDYFAPGVNASPVLHFWSLAVEEQFYLLWPLLLAGLYLIARFAGDRRWWVLRTTVIVLGVASAVEALRIAGTNLDRAYYGTDTRAYQLLAGAFVALTPQLFRLAVKWRAVLERFSLAALLGIVLVGTQILHVGPITRGVIVAALAVALIIGLENARGGAAKRVLSSSPVTYLGRVSYGTYLWHWPVIVLFQHDHHVGPVALFAIVAPASTALAMASFHLLEHPIRVSHVLDRFKVPVITTAFTVSVLTGLFAIPAILQSDAGSSGTLTGITISGTAKTKELLDWRTAKVDFAKRPNCGNAKVEKCILTHGTGLRVVLMGDSHAWMYVPTFVDIAKQRSWTLAGLMYPNCPWQRGLNYDVAANQVATCERHRADWYNRLLPALHPDVIVLANFEFDDPARPFNMQGADKKNIRAGSAGYERLLTDTSGKTIAELHRTIPNIVILEPIPVPPAKVDPLVCISGATKASECIYKATVGPTPLERYYRSLAATTPGVRSLDLDHLICPRYPTCDPIINNVIVRLDGSHITRTFAHMIAPEVEAIFDKAHLLNIRPR